VAGAGYYLHAAVSAAASYTQRDVTIGYVANDSAITLTAVHLDANFDVQVGASIRDSSITGNVKVDVIATPRVTVGFVGVEPRA
jgi:hypothetical protein